MAKRMPNKCIYCQGTGMTKEHYWNRWSKKYQIVSYKSHIHNKELQDERVSIKKDGNQLDHSIRKVCKACNTGWLRNVGERAEPVIKHLIENRPTHLTNEEKLHLATWITTFSMSWEYKDIKTKATPQWERDFIAKNQNPPLTWHIFLSISDNSWCSQTMHAFAAAGDENKKPIGDVQVTTFGLNCLLFHAFSTRLPIDPFFHKSVSDQGPISIWPPNSFTLQPISWGKRATKVEAEDLHFETFNMAFSVRNKTDWTRFS